MPVMKGIPNFPWINPDRLRMQHNTVPTTPRNKRLRILAVIREFSHPPTSGGRQRNWLLIRALQTIGDVDVVAMNSRPPDESDEYHMRERHGLRAIMPMPAHGDLTPWRWLRPVNPRLVQRLAHNLGRRARLYRPHPPVVDGIAQLQVERPYDLVVGRYLWYAVVAGLDRHPRSILDVDDLDTELYRSRLADPTVPVLQRWVLRRHLKQLDLIVHQCLPRFSALWVSNPDERALPGLERASVLVNLPFQAAMSAPPPAYPPKPACSAAVVVGSWGWQPNVHGLSLFLSRVWPQVRQACPDAVLRIIGSNLNNSLRERLSAIPGIEPVGFVDDVSQAYADSAFAIAPVFSGGGTNIKVLEALWHGRTCLVTTAAHRGYHQTLPQGTCLEVADSLDALAASAIKLFSHPRYRDQLAVAGRAAVQEHYSFDSFQRVVSSTVEQVLSTPVPRTTT